MNSRNRRKQAKKLEYSSIKVWASNDKERWKLIYRTKHHPRWTICKIKEYVGSYRYWKFEETYPYAWVTYDRQEASHIVPISDN